MAKNYCCVRAQVTQRDMSDTAFLFNTCFVTIHHGTYITIPQVNTLRNATLAPLFMSYNYMYLLFPIGQNKQPVIAHHLEHIHIQETTGAFY